MEEHPFHPPVALPAVRMTFRFRCWNPITLAAEKLSPVMRFLQPPERSTPPVFLPSPVLDGGRNVAISLLFAFLESSLPPLSLSLSLQPIYSSLPLFAIRHAA